MHLLVPHRQIHDCHVRVGQRISARPLNRKSNPRCISCVIEQPQDGSGNCGGGGAFTELWSFGRRTTKFVDDRDEVADPVGLAHRSVVVSVCVPAEFAHHGRCRMKIAGIVPGAGNGSTAT